MNTIKIFIAFLITAFSVINAYSQRALFLHSNIKGENYLIVENKEVTVYLKNHLILKGKMLIKNDSMIFVDDTTFSISSIDYIKTSLARPAVLIASGTVFCLGSFGSIAGFTTADQTNQTSNSAHSDFCNNCFNDLITSSEIVASYACAMIGCMGLSAFVAELLYTKKFNLKNGIWKAEIVPLTTNKKSIHSERSYH
jgi:hypothetical protein